MMKQIFTQNDIEQYVLKICTDIENSDWRPDYVVGITRDGLIPAVMISYCLNVPMHTLRVDPDGDNEINCWMADEAFGYIQENVNSDFKNSRKNILIVNDINESGATLEWIKKDWRSSCMPNSSDWNTIWGNNVRTAVIVNNKKSTMHVEYSAIELVEPTIDANFKIEFFWQNWCMH